MANINEYPIKKINELEEVTSFTSSDDLLIDNGSELKRIKGDSVQSQIKSVVDKGVDTTLASYKKEFDSTLSKAQSSASEASGYAASAKTSETKN